MDCIENKDNFNALKNDVEKIATKYFASLHRLSKTVKSKKSEAIYIKRVKSAYETLDDLEKQFINNEFFYQEYPDWWKKRYSKTTYYRIKKKSMMDFLEAFNSAQ